MVIKSSSMNNLISQLNGCLTWVGFGKIGLDRVQAARVLEKWFEWHEGNVRKEIERENSLTEQENT